ncbi:MAG: hypothetical protein ABI903_12020 [Actinomycetota bacterium]
MRPRSKAAQRSAADQRAAFADARNLALELAGINTPFTIDAMAAGLVLERGEFGRRMAELWLRMRLGGTWSQPGWSQVLITDRRLLVRLDTGELISLWWGSLVGFEADLHRSHVVLDFGDGRPRSLSGPAVALVAVAGVDRLYGPEALLVHPALAPLRHSQDPVAAEPR